MTPKTARDDERLDRRAISARQLAVSAGFALLLAALVAAMNAQNRSREWTLRTEQAHRRIDHAAQLISQELDRVRADALVLAGQRPLREFASGQGSQLEAVQQEWSNFVERKRTHDQIRFLDPHGNERIRVNYRQGQPILVAGSELQDKSERYYFHDAGALAAGDVAVSEFDLNVEHGQIEEPLKPVIRFMTPVADQSGQPAGLMVLNYLGAHLLSALDGFMLPGATLLLRSDGHYIRSDRPEDAWGWLLGHDRTFEARFPDEWKMVDELQSCQLTPNGAFTARRILLGDHDDSIIAVSYLPRGQVFAASNAFLWRLIWLAVIAFIPLAILAHYWARSVVKRNQQAQRISDSEERLRELSSRLLRIQEEERRAISREIHDELGQQVTAISLDLKLASRAKCKQDMDSHLDRAIGENEGLLQSLHAFATRVRPTLLDDHGLHNAIDSHLHEFQQRTLIEVDSSIDLPQGEIPESVADNAFRILQESLNNVARHADASRVFVHAGVNCRDRVSGLSIEVEDDGRGYVRGTDDRKRLGMVGIRERVDLLEGTMDVETEADGGTRVSVWLPLNGHDQMNGHEQMDGHDRTCGTNP